MNPVMLVVFALILALVAFLVLSAVHLINRGRSKRLKALRYLGLFYLFFTATIVVLLLQEMELSIPYIIATIFLQAMVTCGLLFVQYAFSMKFKNTLKILWIMLVLEGFLNVVYTVLEDTPETYGIGRIGRTIFSNLQMTLVAVVQSVAALRDYKALRHTFLPPHAVKRYLIFGIASMLTPILSSIDIIGTSLDEFGLADYDAFFVIVTSLSFVYCIMIYLTWIMPNRFKAFLDKTFVGIEPATHVPNKTKTPHGHGMDIIEYYGDLLSRLIHQPRNACKGLLLLSISRNNQSESLHPLDAETLEYIFKKELGHQLEILGVQDVKDVIASMIVDIKRNKSLFTIANA